jgi:hypothetical protein
MYHGFCNDGGSSRLAKRIDLLPEGILSKEKEEGHVPGLEESHTAACAVRSV